MSWVQEARVLSRGGCRPPAAAGAAPPTLFTCLAAKFQRLQPFASRPQKTHSNPQLGRLTNKSAAGQSTSLPPTTTHIIPVPTRMSCLVTPVIYPMHVYTPTHLPTHTSLTPTQRHKNQTSATQA